MNELEHARTTIDDVDRRLLALLAERMAAVREVAAIKHDSGRTGEAAPLHDEQRERALFATWTAEGERLGLSSYFVGRVLREVLDHSRRDQERVLSGRGAAGRVRVAYLGETGAYGELALQKLMTTRDASRVEARGLRSFTACCDALEAGEVDYALLPIENSIAGSINEVYELLARRRVHVVDEEDQEVEHRLLGLPGARVEDLRAVRSHPVALQQCGRYLSALVGVGSESATSTAGAARDVAERGDPTLAAIASAEAGRLHGLEVLATDVADRPGNHTRFLLVALEPETPAPCLAARTSLLFTLTDRYGALARGLAVFAERGLNLSKLESRPLPDSPGEVLFYLDVDARGDDPALAEALESLRPLTNHLRVLGSYPRRSARLGMGEGVRAERAAPRPAAEEDPRAIDVFSVTEAPPAAASSRPLPAAPARLAEAEHQVSTLRVGPFELGPDRFGLIAGPCAVESREQVLAAAALVKRHGATMLRGGAYKPRTSPYSFQGLGREGVELLVEAGRAVGLPVVTEVLRPEDVEHVAEAVDVLQVGARNMQNFALLAEVGRSHRPVLLKRGLSATIEELLLAAEYVLAAGNNRVVLCERGIRTFERATRATLDLSAVPVLKERTQLPVIVDPSHAAGRRALVAPLAWAAAAVGADGVIVEAHPHPEDARCDKDQALGPDDLARLVDGLDPLLAAQGRRPVRGRSAGDGDRAVRSPGER